MAARLIPRCEFECIDSSMPNVAHSVAMCAERTSPPQ